jgi:hypothetical protein
MTTQPSLLVLAAVIATASLSPPLAGAGEPLASRIDRLIEAKAKAENVPLSPPADDAEFLRRVYLDFAGTVPSAVLARQFLADTHARKRDLLIEQLLAAPEYAPRMADLFNVMIMERLGEHPEWTKYLRASFATNKPWNAMAREILHADSRDSANLGASFFIAKRLENYGQNPVDYSGLTRDVGRLFIGKNFQCCECHDHLFVDDYKQQHFQGLHTFLRNAMLVNAAKLQVGEKPLSEKTNFASVFTKVMMSTGPALPGMMMLEIPPFVKGMEFVEPPDKKKGSPGVPKFSTLAALSEQLPKASNPDFARNMANRLWFALMGRGIVHPLDMHHSKNLGSHPELLDLLANEFASHAFDIKWLLRELALTKAYQRSSLVAAGRESADSWFFATALERRLSAEQLWQSASTAMGADAATAAKLRPRFIKAFANQPREPEDEIAPSLKAALFVLHDEAVLALLKPAAGNLVDRLAKLPDGQVADELYLSIVTRRPTTEESKMVETLLRKHGSKKPEAIGRLAWSLLASMEFSVNH